MYTPDLFNCFEKVIENGKNPPPSSPLFGFCRYVSLVFGSVCKIFSFPDSSETVSQVHPTRVSLKK